MQSPFKLLLKAQSIAFKAAMNGSLWSAGKKYGVGSFIKPINSPTRYPEYHCFFELISKEVSLKKNAHILDVGSPKLFPLILAQTVPVHISSIDSWHVPIDEAEALAGGLTPEIQKRIHLAVADIRVPLEKKLLPDGNLFDITFAMSVIEHIEPPLGGDQLALQSMAQLTKSDGCLIASIPVDTHFREEYLNTNSYGSKSSFFQRVYDTAALNTLCSLAQINLNLKLEEVIWIQWPQNPMFKSFWKIKNTTVRGLLGPAFPFFASWFQIYKYTAIPEITTWCDIVLKFRKGIQ